MKKYNLFVLTMALTFTSCGGAESSNDPQPYYFVVKEIETPHTKLVADFFNSEKYDYKDLDPSVYALVDLGDNTPINISWSPVNGVSSYKLVIEDDEQTFNYSVVGNTFDFNNYKLDTNYKVHYEIGEIKSNEIEFKTPQGFVRTIKVDGVGNFRDLGEGETIKQGLLYRSMTFENNTINNRPTGISEEGIQELYNLGIKSEIDLRKESERGEDYGTLQNINYQFNPLYYGGQNILTYKSGEFDNPNEIKNVLEFMSDESNYPIVFHCIRGTDRTGCLAFIIKALLGVDEDLIKKDFIFSNFYNIGSPVKLESIEYPHNPSAVTKYVNVLKQEDGGSLQEKTYNYLINKLSLSSDKVNSLISILKVNNG